MLEIILSVTTVILNTGLGLFVLLRNTKSWTNRLFFALTFFINGYVFTNYLSLHPPGGLGENQLFWIRIVMFETSFLGPTLLLLVHTFPRDKIRVKPIKLISLLLLMTVSAIASLTPLVFSSISYPEGQPVPSPGPAMPIFVLDFGGLFLLSIILLIYKYRKTTGIERVQHLYFLVGVILTFSLMGLTANLFVVVFKFTGLVFLGPIYSIFLVAFIAYSIVKHRFLDIKLVVARSVAYSLLVLILATLYASSLFIIGTFITKDPSTTSNLLSSTLLALVIAFTFQPLRRYLEKITDNIFYKDHYDMNKLLGTLSKIMASTFQLEELSFQVLNQLVDKLKVSRGAFVLTEDSTITWVKSVGYKKAPNFDEKQITKLVHFKSSNNSNIIVFDELIEGEMKDLMRKNDIEVYVPLETEQGRIGALIMAEKSSGDIYSSEDLNVLEIVGPQISIAIENAKAYEEIRRFNVTLKEEVKKATANLRRANKRLREMDKLKDEFVSVTSHELRTPMTAVKSYLWMVMNKDKHKMGKKAQEHMQRAYTSTERTINLVNDMLDVSRIEAGRFEVKMQTVDVVAVAKNVVTELKAKADEKKLKLAVEAEDMPKVKADPEKIYQVLDNLLGNSVKFTPEKGEIKVSFAKKNGFVQVNVADTGPGISKADQKRLFKKFGRLENSFVSIAESGGTGLGLFISKQIIDIHKGKIWVESAVGKGSTFSFTLPVAK